MTKPNTQLARECAEKITRLNSMVVGGYLADDTMHDIILAALQQSQARDREVIERAVVALEKNVKETEQSLKDIGGCDHSVGICCCEMIRNIEDGHASLTELRALLASFPPPSSK